MLHLVWSPSLAAVVEWVMAQVGVCYMLHLVQALLGVVCSLILTSLPS